MAVRNIGPEQRVPVTEFGWMQLPFVWQDLPRYSFYYDQQATYQIPSFSFAQTGYIKVG